MMIHCMHFTHEKSLIFFRKRILVQGIQIHAKVVLFTAQILLENVHSLDFMARFMCYFAVMTLNSQSGESVHFQSESANKN